MRLFYTTGCPSGTPDQRTGRQGLGLGVSVGIGVGVGIGDGVSLGCSDSVGEDVGVDDGTGVAVGAGLADGNGVGGRGVASGSRDGNGPGVTPGRGVSNPDGVGASAGVESPPACWRLWAGPPSTALASASTSVGFGPAPGPTNPKSCETPNTTRMPATTAPTIAVPRRAQATPNRSRVGAARGGGLPAAATSIRASASKAPSRAVQDSQSVACTAISRGGSPMAPSTSQASSCAWESVIGRNRTARGMPRPERGQSELPPQAWCFVSVRPPGTRSGSRAGRA